jgi:hypothetical protein
MPSLNVSFTEAELDTVRAAAGDDVSLPAFAHAAILSAAMSIAGERPTAHLVAAQSAELNRRLA